MTTSKTQNIRIPILLILSAFLAAHLCFWLLPNVFEIWNSQTIDQIFILRSKTEKLRPVYDPTVVHLDFNNTSIERLKNLYLNRFHFAQLVRNLKSMQVAAQVYDFIFAAKINEQDDLELIESVKDAGNAYFGLALELRLPDQPGHKKSGPSKGRSYVLRTKWNVAVDDNGKLYVGKNPLATYADLANASRGLGSLSVKFDPDGVLRRVPLLVRYEDALYPLLPLRVICDYLQVPPEKIVFAPGRHLILQGATRPGSPGSEPYDIKIPIDRHGNMIVNYIGPWGRMDHYNFADILRASDDRDELEIWAEELKGKIVIISDVSTGSTDIGPVPTDANFPLSGVHANVIQNILTESFLRELSGREMLLIECLLLAVLFLLSIRFSSLTFSLGTAFLAAAYIGIAIVSFLYAQVIFNLVRPLLMIGFAMVSIVVYRYILEEKAKMESLRQQDFIRDTFGRYLSSEVVGELLDSPEGLKMSGENREVTFLVSDLRGFTALTSRLPPHEVIEIMNRYFEYMVDIIARYRGTVSEFTGDGILAFFGAPLYADDDPERAVACAVEMQNALAAVNAEQRQLKLPELAMGIGINTGEVVVGNIGSEKRASYGAVGAPINAAHRIESFTVGGQVLISPSTYDRVGADLTIIGTREVKFKGLDQPVRLYDVGGIGDPYQVFLPQKKEVPMKRLSSPLPIECFLLEGKTVSDNAIIGRITCLGENAAEASLDQTVDMYANLRILITGQEAPGFSELYAKVMPKEQSDAIGSGDGIRIEFTSVPDEVKKFLSNTFSGKPATP
ncbi:MAG: adenylate/guanylate cyclase domain-containing protein [Desulfobacterales bacterium]|nr:adenylate/guanylate cyclase domain-containing protein [Desulfobacterales bacterium]